MDSPENRRTKNRAIFPPRLREYKNRRASGDPKPHLIFTKSSRFRTETGRSFQIDRLVNAAADGNRSHDSKKEGRHCSCRPSCEVWIVVENYRLRGTGMSCGLGSKTHIRISSRLFPYPLTTMNRISCLVTPVRLSLTFLAAKI